VDGAERLLQQERLVCVGQRAVDFLSLLRYARPELLLACEGGPEAAAISAEFQVPLATMEECGLRRRWSGPAVEQLLAFAPAVARLVGFRRQGGSGSRHLWIVPYLSTPGWQRLVDDTPGLRLLAPRPSLTTALENKTQLRARLRAAAFPVPPSCVRNSSRLNFPDLSRRLGLPLVFQASPGSSGFGTRLVSDAHQARRYALEHPDTAVLVSRHVGPTVVNVHGCTAGRMTVISAASLQLAGIPATGAHGVIYCGNDFGAASEFPPAVSRAVAAWTSRLGSWLLEQGFQGIFGADFCVSGERVFLLEVNPRLQGSTWLLGEAERAAGVEPLLVAHVARAMSAAMLAPSWEGHDREPDVRSALTGGQLILRWPGPGVGLTRGELSTGIYRFDGRTLVWRRAGRGLTDCGLNEVYLGGLPGIAKSRVEPGAVLARVACWPRLAGVDSGTLSSYGSRLAAGVQNLLIPASASDPSAAS
jgi:hypothetical protein